jgi:hypothetical protein
MNIGRRNVNYGFWRRIWAIVLLLSFWRIPAYGEPRTTPQPTSSESGTRRYSEYEVDALIEDLTAAAAGAIEQAAGDAAKAAALASLEREAAAVREARRLLGENSRLKQDKVKTAIVTGTVCFFGGLAVGAGSIALLQGGR